MWLQTWQQHLHLIEKQVEGCGHMLYMDSFFWLPDLFSNLTRKKTSCCRACKPNRNGMPQKSASCWFHTWLFWPWRWRQYISLKCQLTYAVTKCYILEVNTPHRLSCCLLLGSFLLGWPFGHGGRGSMFLQNVDVLLPDNVALHARR